MIKLTTYRQQTDGSREDYPVVELDVASALVRFTVELLCPGMMNPRIEEQSTLRVVGKAENPMFGGTDVAIFEGPETEMQAFATVARSMLLK
jgi:hypothetical protein